MPKVMMCQPGDANFHARSRQRFIAPPYLQHPFRFHLAQLILQANQQLFQILNNRIGVNLRFVPQAAGFLYFKAGQDEGVFIFN